MIIERFTHTAKPGCRKELVELLKGWVEGAGAPGRVFTPGLADWERVELDLEFETVQDRDKFWAGYDPSQPGVAEFYEKNSDLRESGSTRVRWEMQ